MDVLKIVYYFQSLLMINMFHIPNKIIHMLIIVKSVHHPVCNNNQVTLKNANEMF